MRIDLLKKRYGNIEKKLPFKIRGNAERKRERERERGGEKERGRERESERKREGEKKRVYFQKDFHKQQGP